MPFKTVVVIALLGWMSAGCGSRDVPSLKEGLYNISSDCPGATSSSGSVKLKKGSVTGPGDYDLENATDYGLPTRVLVRGGPRRINAGGAPRSCKAFIFEEDATETMFACHEAGDLVCTVKISRTGDFPEG